MTSDRPDLLFRLVAVASGLFIVTVLAVLAAMLGNPRAPAARFLQAHGGTLIAVEVAAILLLGFWAMARDRLRTLRQSRREDRDGDSVPPVDEAPPDD